MTQYPQTVANKVTEEEMKLIDEISHEDHVVKKWKPLTQKLINSFKNMSDESIEYRLAHLFEQIREGSLERPTLAPGNRMTMEISGIVITIIRSCNNDVVVIGRTEWGEGRLKMINKNEEDKEMR